MSECADYDDLAFDHVCDIDPYCCNVDWDYYCVEEWEEDTDSTCPPLFRGNYSTGVDGLAEISEFAADACGGADPNDCQWSFQFDLPTNPIAGSSTGAGVGIVLDCDEDAGGGAGGGWVEIFSSSNGRLRGVLESDWLGTLEGACSEQVEGLLFEVVPQTNKSCYSHSGAPGCNRPTIETCVCHDDPYCCLTAWDFACVAQAYDCPYFL